ncbi:MAG: amidohydrolase family protein [Candidatus Binatia bacterium]|nr:amidohydrolase family protein [Candidatus Binatia bacterium]
MIVDTHTHIVSPDRERYPLRPYGLPQGDGAPARWFDTHAVSAEDLIAAGDAAGIDRTVAVQAMGAYSYDNSYCLDAASEHSPRLGSVCIVDPLDPTAPKTLERLVVDHGARGVRLFTITHPESTWLDEAPGVAVIDVATQLGIPIVATLLSNQMPKLENLLAAHPRAKVALDHCGFPDLRGGPPFQGATTLCALTRHPNLHLKVSTHLLGAIERSGDDVRDFVDHLHTIFGPGRLLWGSDYPQTHDRSYAEMVAFARHACSRLDDAAQASFLGGAALSLWPDPSD